MRKRRTGERGLIKMILIIVIALLIISYFGISLRSVASSPTTQDNFSYVTTGAVTIWNNYLKAPAGYIWHKIFIELIWNPAIDNLRKT